MSPEPVPHALAAAEAEVLNERSLRLMARVRQGDHHAFQELVEMHQAAVVGTCARMLGGMCDAEDIAQQVFLRVWKSAPRYEPTARFTTWLFTIVKHLVFNECRRRARHPVVPLDGGAEGAERRSDRGASEVADVSARPADAIAHHRELEAAINLAIAELPDQQRLAVTLRKYEHLPYEEIAKVLGTSVPSAKSLLFRARARLRTSLRPFLDS